VRVDGPDEIWLPLVDEPIAGIVEQIQAEHPEIDRLVDTPRRLLAFRTFATIRVGVALGRLLVEHDVEPDDGAGGTWVDTLLADPAHRALVVAEVRAVAEEIAADTAYAEAGPLGPDDAARERFRSFARRTPAGG
jgi:hypothetical protein